MSKWNIYSSDCRILFHKKPTEWGISFISSNLRNIRSTIQFQIPQIVGFLCARKPTEWGIFFAFHQSEEYSEFHSTSDSSDCSVSNMTKATNWGSLKNVSLAYFRILSDKNPTEWRIFSDILQSEEDLFSNSNSDSSDCRILLH